MLDQAILRVMRVVLAAGVKEQLSPQELAGILAGIADTLMSAAVTGNELVAIAERLEITQLANRAGCN